MGRRMCELPLQRERANLRYLTQSRALERSHLLIRAKRITHHRGNTFNQLCTLNTLLDAAWALIAPPRPPSPPSMLAPREEVSAQAAVSIRRVQLQ